MHIRLFCVLFRFSFLNSAVLLLCCLNVDFLYVRTKTLAFLRFFSWLLVLHFWLIASRIKRIRLYAILSRFVYEKTHVSVYFVVWLFYVVCIYVFRFIRETLCRSTRLILIWILPHSICVVARAVQAIELSSFWLRNISAHKLRRIAKINKQLLNVFRFNFIFKNKNK